MCMLTYIPDGVQPDTDALQNGALWNDDGHGFAIADTRRGHMIVRRGMDSDRVIDEFAKVRAAHPDGPALFHSRWGTAGLRGKVNCHPFLVGGDPLTVVGHNGVLPSECQPKKGDPRCDTRIFAERHLPQRNIDRRKNVRRLTKWLRGDKLVILTLSERYAQTSYILNENRGNWDGETGIWYSNYDHMDWRSSYRFTGGAWTPYVSRAVYANAWVAGYTGEGTSQDLATRAPGACEVCQAYGTVSEVTGLCTACLSCQDCHAEMDECLCYVSATRARLAESNAQSAAESAFYASDEEWRSFVCDQAGPGRQISDRPAVLEAVTGMDVSDEEETFGSAPMSWANGRIVADDDE